MIDPAAADGPEQRDPPFPRVPAYAWRWLQRSRPVIAEAARRLTGAAPERDFLERLQRSFAEDPFVRDVLVDVIADVAFQGRVPSRRPAGASWDRGLIWWAATLAGVSPADFERRSAEDTASQHRLFDVPGRPPAGRAPPLPPRPVPAGAGAERRRLAAALRQLLESAEGGTVPASSLRQLLDQLEGDTTT